MDYGELQTLRSRVRDLLGELQDLPGFATRRAQLPEPPKAFREVPWRVVLAQIDGATRDAALWMKPHDPTAGEESYAKAVSDFARDFVFGAEWSSRALHFALQRDQLVGLPPGKPDPWYRADRALSIEVQAGEPISASLREHLRTFLDQLAPVTPQEPELKDTTKARLHDEAARSPRMVRHIEAVEEYERQYVAPPGSRSQPSSFDTNARHALEGIRLRLAGTPLSDMHRQGLRRLRRHLNAAVNGEYDAPMPLEPTDAAERGLVRRREKDALAASTASSRIRKAGERRGRSGSTE